jgi:hypothetical protein
MIGSGIDASRLSRFITIRASQVVVARVGAAFVSAMSADDYGDARQHPVADWRVFGRAAPDVFLSYAAVTATICDNAEWASAKCSASHKINASFCFSVSDEPASRSIVS